MSAYPLRADMRRVCIMFREVPYPDLRTATNGCLFDHLVSAAEQRTPNISRHSFAAKSRNGVHVRRISL